VDRYIQDHAPASIRPQLLAAAQNISDQVQEQSRNLSKGTLATAGTISSKVALQTFNLVSSGTTMLFQVFIVAILSFFLYPLFMECGGRVAHTGARTTPTAVAEIISLAETL
jgi:hypothetical protein